MRSSFVYGALLVAFACGGKAVIDGKPSDGGGGAGANISNGAGGVMSTTSPTIATTTGAGGAPSTACSEACAIVSSCVSVPEQECVSRCQTRLPECAAQHDAYLECVIDDEVDTCVFGNEQYCFGEAQVFLNCTVGAIETSVCSGPECACTVTTQEGATLFNDCFGNDCECFVNGENVGKCVNGSLGSPCDPFASCCFALYGIYALPGG